jgi:hypothetical protein
LLKSPVAPTLEIEIGAAPVLVKVTDFAALEVSIAWSANVSDAGTEALGVTAVT